MTRAADLAELGLTEGNADERAIRTAYLRLAKTRHPDKGGNKDQFQRLSNAYTRLSQDSYAETSAAPASASHYEARAGDSYDEEFDQDEEEDYWHGRYYDFFHRAWGFGFATEDDFDDYFASWRETSRRERQRQRREELKRGYDYRDSKATARTGKCMFCGDHAPITKNKAISHGIKWDEYTAHPAGYRTCWACKDNHISVMTEAQACTKFAKVLDYKIKSKNTGNYYRPVFWFLKLDGKSFHHQPITGYYEGPTRNSEYYWYPDLEDAALAHGWKPRGKQKEQVPWVRKDLSDSNVMVLSGRRRTSGEREAPPKKRRAIMNQDSKESAAAVTPEKGAESRPKYI